MARTRASGLPPGELAFSSVLKPMTEEHGFELMDRLAGLAEGAALSPADIAFQCARVSFEMRKHVGDVASVQALLTIGTVEMQGRLLWNANGGMTLTDLCDSGAFHVWLTLPDMQVIDFTLMMTLAVQKGRDPREVHPIATYPDSEPHTKWIPLFTGDAAYTRLLKLAA